ncbi:maleylpyruvate isomerase N-terminal domain-containing protein [Brevibacterium sediminis]|uniref:Mycothiol-dependent maleylpyruvate isomerase metal-binding domain-containing protein n=1 Tax=Brevibacterium sediminis TaxID=1857024 RepID=A0A5C4X6W1_9MICO|nr:maleylpyruvate isomerase N-terminal domain-containing protein [Brevibacterium sediminis]TNM58101.1 hypothetical protein FHQ09_02140 [Brevibacterium sediminis]
MDEVTTTQLDQAEACWVTALRRVRTSDLNRTSGAAEWSNAELINHLIGGGVRYTKLLQQASTEEVEATRGADHLGEDMLDSFWTHERTFRALVYECDLHAPVAHRIGSIPGAQLVQMRILELALHAADLSRGTGHDWPIDESLAEFISTELGDLIIDLGPEGGYRPPRPIGGGVTHAQRVLLLSGR